MKKLILPLLFAFICSPLALAKINSKLNLNIKLQKSNTKIKDINLDLIEGVTQKAITNAKTGEKIEIRVNKIKGNLYKVQLKLKEKNKLIRNETLDLKINNKTLLQSFDSQGNSEYKLVLEANKR